MQNTAHRPPFLAYFPAKSRASCGVTLVETVVWVGVFTFAMIALTSALLSFYRTNSSAIKESSAIAAAQRGMDNAVKAIRIVSYSANGQYPVVSIGANQFSFYANITPGSGQIQKIRLFVAGSSLYEGVIQPSGDPPSYVNPETIYTLADYVQNLTVGTSTFGYYDQSGALINDYNQFVKVRFITINLVVDASTTSIPAALSLRSSAAMRNLIGN